MKPHVLLITFASLIMPWIMPSNADACAATPLVHEISLSDEGNAFPECLGFETLGGPAYNDAEVYLKIDNTCDETFHLEATDLSWFDSITVEPGETESWWVGDNYEVYPISISWTLGEGEANPAQMNMESYYPDWDTCPYGCNQSATRTPFTPLALFLLGGVLMLVAIKRYALRSSFPA